MLLRQIRIFAVLICLTTSVGCNQSNRGAIAQVQAEAETARAEAQAAKAELAKEKARADAAETELARLKTAAAQPHVPEADRRAAEWVLRAGGIVRTTSDGIASEYPKDGKLPDGAFNVTYVDLVKPSDEKKLTNEGMQNLSGLKHVKMLNLHVQSFDDLSFLDGMDSLDTFHGVFTDDGLFRLKKLPHIKDLAVGGWFGNPKVTDVGLAHIKELKNLEVLHLSGCDITNSGLQSLSDLKHLTYLSLFRTRISDEGLQHLKGLSALRELMLEGTQITGTGLDHLKELPSLVTVNMNATKVTDAELAHLKVLPQLTAIHLCYNPLITDAGLVHLKALSRLTVLNLVDTKITDDGIKKLKMSLPNCEVIKR